MKGFVFFKKLKEEWFVEKLDIFMVSDFEMKNVKYKFVGVVV